MTIALASRQPTLEPENGEPLALRWVPLNSLRAFGRKARTHSKDQIRKIADSIKAFGFSVPIMIDDDNRILAGNGRIEAARILGMETVPVVVMSHLSDAQKRAFVVAENRLAELAGWDRGILQAELRELAELNLNFDLAVIGFDDAQIEALVLEGDAGLARADTVPPLQQTAVCQPGDVWLLGDHRICCGDSLDAAVLEAVLGDEQAAAIFTDPPFNVSVDGHVTRSGAHREFAMASGEMDDAEFTTFLAKVWAQAEHALQPGGLAYVCMDWRHVRHMLEGLAGRNLEQLNLIVWDKVMGGMGSFYRSRHELIFLVRKAGAPHTNRIQLGKNGRDRCNVWSYEGMSGTGSEKVRLRALHPTVKPVEMVRDALLDSTRKGDVVVDLFLGSGTTLLAADMTGRKCRAIELDPLYCDVAIRRWEAFRGEEARLASSGRTFTAVWNERAQPATNIGGAT